MKKHSLELSLTSASSVLTCLGSLPLLLVVTADLHNFKTFFRVDSKLSYDPLFEIS